MSVLEVKNLKTFFPITGGIFSTVTSHVKAVNDVSLTVDKGEIVSIVGESGCGKSTLGLSVLGLTPVSSGRLFFDGREIDTARTRSWAPFRKELQIIFQDPFTSLNPRHTIFRILAEPMVIHQICSRNTADDAVVHLMEQVGLSPDYRHRFPHAFSGGQRQRIAIARAISVKPKLIVCDEVVSALDVSVQAQIIQLLLDLKIKMDLSLLFIAHDLSLVKAISDRVNVMYLGKIVESALCKELFTTPHHPYTEALLNAIPTLDRTIKPKILPGEVPSPINVPTGCIFQTRCPYAREICGECHPETTISGQRSYACNFPLHL
jgi:oligopeptide/dipeptide ABC transporter ATP-binding protein